MNNASAAESLFFGALEKGNAAEQSAYLDSACGDDAELRRQVEKMLNAYPQVGDFLNKPVGEQLAAALEPSGATEEFRGSTDREEPSLERTEGEGSGNDEEADDLHFLSPSADPYSLGRIGHYEILQLVGKGGFGIVLRAFDEVLQRVVALKVLAPALAAASVARKRFLREARSSAQVRHDNVVQVHAVEEQPLPYLVMEFIPGETLQQRLDRGGPLQVPEIVSLGRQLAEGLAAAHATGLIHRDIKPANMLIEDVWHVSNVPGAIDTLETCHTPRVKITDFGMARAADDASLSQNGVLAGTPMYMAPEQAEGETLDHRADLFSLGSVLYTMCTGRPPFRGSTTRAVLKRVVEDQPRPIRDVVPEIPQWLCNIIARLHAKKPEDRFATATEVAELLGRCLAEMQRPGSVPEAAPAIRRPRFRSRRWAAAAAVFLMLLGSLGFTEAFGVTNFHSTVIRLFSPEGTLVVEVDDPKVSVQIDGSEIVITGAGVQEIRLKPGRYTVEANKDGKLVRRELVTVTNNGREVVRVHQETQHTDAAAWERSASTLPAVERAKAVAIRLQELNPGFDGAITPTIEHGVVTGLEINIDRVTDISPLRLLTGLTSITCLGSDAFQGQFVNGTRSTGYEEGRINIRSVGKSRFADLSPLKGLPLTRLSCVNCDVSDLTPLKGMKLKYLHVGSTLVHDLSPLKGMPLEDLDFSFTKVSDIAPLKGLKLATVGFEATDVSDLTPLKGMALRHLVIGRKTTDLSPLAGMPLEGLTCHEAKVSDLSPLKGMPLKLLNCGGTLVSDISPLKGMPLSHLGLDNTKVSDLAPLRGMRLIDLGVPYTKVSDLSPLVGMPLEKLQIQGSKVTDLSPVKDLPLTWLVCDFRPERDAKILRAIPTLKTINDKPAVEFWRSVENK